MYLADRLADIVGGGEPGHFHLWMVEQPPQNFRTAIPGASDDRRLHRFRRGNRRGGGNSQAALSARRSRSAGIGRPSAADPAESARDFEGGGSPWPATGDPP